MKHGKPITIYEIGRLTGVSIATVSRALNAHTRHKVAEDTWKKIDATVKKYGYTPSLAARYLGGSMFQTIGVILPQGPGVFHNDYYVKVLAGISDGLLETAYQFKLIMAKSGDDRWDRYDFKAGEAVEGLIVTHWHVFFSRASVFKRLRLPCVVINDPEPNVRAHFVCGDHEMGGELAARHLYEHGHRKIAVLTGPTCSSDSRHRLEGFRRFFQRTGSAHELTIVEGGEFQEDRARAVTEAFLRTRRSVTAFFCLNDDMALGVLKQLRASGLSCPGDFSIVGYDGDPRTERTDPPLTTVRVPLYDVAKEGARQLVRYLTGEQRANFFDRRTFLPVELVERASVRQLEGRVQ